MESHRDQIRAGWSAHGRDGEKIGDVEEVGQSYFLVTKGLIFTKDLFIPFSAIEELDTAEGRVYLNVDKAEVDRMNWGEPPAVTTDAATGGIGGLGYTGSDTTADSVTGSYATTDQTTEGLGYTGAATPQDGVGMPVRQEELRTERRREEVYVDEDAGGVLAGAGSSSITGGGGELRDTAVSHTRRSGFDPDDATETGGAAAGALGGAAVGGALGGPPGAVVGGAIGAAGGAVAGDKLDADEPDDRDHFSAR